MNFNLLEDIKLVLNKYPLLKLEINTKDNILRLIGEIEVIEPITKNFIDLFQVEIYYPPDFPKCYPVVIETGGKIPRNTSRHIMLKTNNLCFSVEMEEIILCKHGITTIWFFDNILLPRLAEEYIVNLGGKYQKEYSHDFDGTWEYLMKIFNTNDETLIISIIEKMVKHQLPKNNGYCICQANELFRECHRKEVVSLQQLGNDYLCNLYKIIKTNLYKGKNLK